MDINIKMLNGTVHTLTVYPDDTVGKLKNLIHSQFGEPPHKQKLVFVNGQRIDLSDDSRTVGSYGLKSGSTVSLLVTQPAKFQVLLKNDRGRTNAYDITPEETVQGFKAKVEQREKVPVSQQRLVYHGREMMNGKLSDYQVEANGTIDLCLRLRGG
uniref:Interferon-stimulated gene 15 n=1 Tax=Channa argus TaxID=215402 RepID=A0T068_CHAAH|nr:interferon-stimulated gene 15 [Channa argus]